MDEMTLNVYWTSLPIGRKNAVDYATLCEMWCKSERMVRRTLHELSRYDNGDDYVLIRSSKTNGFYKTDDKGEIAAYRKECLNKGRSVFAPVKKCNRVLRESDGQIGMFNNLRAVRESLGMKQRAVCTLMKKYDRSFDVSLLSKMENGVCLPTFGQLAKLAEIYGVERAELLRVEFPSLGFIEAI